MSLLSLVSLKRTNTMIEPFTGRQLQCISISKVAEMVHDIRIGTDARLAIMDEYGTEKEIIAISQGDFKDTGNKLLLGSNRAQIILDSDSCDAAAAAAIETESTPQDIEDRHLIRRGKVSQTLDRSQLSRSDILVRHREQYISHRADLKMGKRILSESAGDDLVEITQISEPDECSLTREPDLSDTEPWLKRFQPCGWYRSNCTSLSNVEVLEANVVYPPNRDRDEGREEDDKDLEKGRGYIVQFDVGINQAVVDANDLAPFKSYYPVNGVSSGVLELKNGLDLDSDTYTTDAYVVGETCLEVYTEAEGDWGIIHGNGYGCMGKCGRGCEALSGGYAKNCMKHDVCSAFKSTAQGVATGGNCKDVDCGDEQMHTVAYCNKGGLLNLPVTCRKEDFDEDSNYDIRITMGASFFFLTVTTALNQMKQRA
mmetsp:Transcript_2835/g.6059  ORF Transcript_2835/g.6059 Transcript_2835/m.6059 type:complete len:427 (+) Transcript_2835:35-1315(+)